MCIKMGVGFYNKKVSMKFSTVLCCVPLALAVYTAASEKIRGDPSRVFQNILGIGAVATALGVFGVCSKEAAMAIGAGSVVLIAPACAVVEVFA